MIDLLTSDTGILLTSLVGLAMTTVSILRDARAQRERAARESLALQLEDRAA